MDPEKEISKEVRLHFLGAAGCVTGSRFVLETPELNLMIDCGLFQGEKELRELNWSPLGFDPMSIDHLLLTHGHLDHVGYIPRLYAQGFRGQIHGTAPTLAIARIILEDSARIQEEDAEKANAEGYSSHHPALPLYTVEMALQSFSLFEPQPKDEWITLSENLRFRFRYAGHILGATFIELEAYGRTLVFSGDLGRQEDVLLRPPERPEKADFLIVESTYGNREHLEEDIPSLLEDQVNQAIHKGGSLIIPSFAVERSQQLLYYFWELYRKNRIPDLPLVLDSPMGSKVLDIFFTYANWHKLDQEVLSGMTRHVTEVESYADTWKTIDDPRSKIVIAGSGMVTGGRVLTYLQQLIDETKTSVLLVGYQAEGTRGRDLKEGAASLRFFGKDYPVRASVSCLESLSAHADQSEILDWISGIGTPPEQVFLVHGEAEGALGLQEALQQHRQWTSKIPLRGEQFSLFTVG